MIFAASLFVRRARHASVPLAGYSRQCRKCETGLHCDAMSQPAGRLMERVESGSRDQSTAESAI